jgi:hypothetical protein
MQLIVFSLVVVLGPLFFYPHTLGAEFSLSLSTLLLFDGCAGGAVRTDDFRSRR